MPTKIVREWKPLPVGLRSESVDTKLSWAPAGEMVSDHIRTFETFRDFEDSWRLWKLFKTLVTFEDFGDLRDF